MTSPRELPNVPLWVVDTSVWARVGLNAEVKQALAARAETGLLAMAPPVALDVGYSARSAADWDAVQRAMAGLIVLPMGEQTYEIARDLQRDLWHNGLVRAVGCTDLLVAAVAIENNGTVVHYDRDYEFLTRIRPGFKQEWIVPAGQVA